MDNENIEQQLKELYKQEQALYLEIGLFVSELKK